MTKREVTQEELARPLVSYEDAVATILSSFELLAPGRVPLIDALGLVLAENLVSDVDVPGFDNSAMDGYAIVSSDTQTPPVTLRLVDDLPAGTAPTVTIMPGTAATIMTGAPLPPGADAVVPWEDTTRAEDAVTVNAQITPRRHVRPAGEDVRNGDTIVSGGTVLDAVHLGVAASVGLTHVQAHPRPRIAVLSTGDELVSPGGKLMGGQIFDANRTMISLMCASAGADVVADALLADDPEVIGEWLHGVDADLIVTSGGASVGEHDWIRAILEKEGSLAMWRVAIKPGKPIALGKIGTTPVLALPGNPGSAFVGLHVFVLPAIRLMAGRDPAPARITATLGGDVKGSPSRTQFTRVRVEDGVAHPLPAQSSVVLSNLVPADGFAVVPPGGLPEGASVTVELR